MNGKPFVTIVDLRSSFITAKTDSSKLVLNGFCSSLRKLGTSKIIGIVKEGESAEYLLENGVDTTISTSAINTVQDQENNLTVFFPADCYWADSHLLDMILEAGEQSSDLHMNKFQTGYMPIIYRSNASPDKIFDHFDPVAFFTAMSNNGKSASVSFESFGRHNIYLKTDEAEGIDVLIRMYKSGQSQSDLNRVKESSSFKVLNRRFMIKQLERISVFCDLRGKKVLEIGASPTNSVLGDLLIDKYGLPLHRPEY